MLLLLTLLHQPGVGGPEPLAIRDNSDQHHSALAALRAQIRTLAAARRCDWPPAYPSTATLRKDIQLLRQWGFLEDRMYRWGYYLGTAVLTRRELQVALNALASQAKFQADPQVRQIYKQLQYRLRGFHFETEGDSFYPVREIYQRSIEWTDPEEMVQRGENRRTLFHCIETLEVAIARGQPIEIFRTRAPYGNQQLGAQIAWPLQLLYSEIAWYLLLENCADGHLAVGRVSRYCDRCRVLDPGGRGLPAQQASLDRANRLLAAGWGLFLGEPEEQQAELADQLPLTAICVRFYPPISTFIAEGDRRHPRLRLRPGRKDPQTQQPVHLDFHIELPPRSHHEFLRWLQRYGGDVEVMAPAELRAEHRKRAMAIAQRYRV
ncbi:MAG: WYL domain-containing protein [Spirulinaceae cyanobacterium SM2_1_0]|nr:WYL domain-containing protein [Spirulinaceae cyanobacterium SM2_1_0]